jgi:cytochrome P450
MVFDYDSVKRVLTDHTSFSSHAVAGRVARWMVFQDPPRHTKLRALITSAFTPKSILNLETRIRNLSAGLIDSVIEKGEMDLLEEYAVPLPMKVIAQMLGIPSQDWPQFRRWSDVILNLSYSVPGGEAGKQAEQQFAAVWDEMSAYLAELLKERRASPKDDLLTRLLEAEVDGERLAHDEILGFFQLLLVAGHETTTNLISNTILCLLEYPDQLARIRADPALTGSAVEEVLRFRSPVQWMFRAVKRRLELHDQTIPAGTLILTMIGSANRDPRVFANAGQFDIARDPNPHIAFGQGAHFCLGAPLARLEARVAIPDLLGHLRDLEVTEGKAWQPRKALHVHGPARLPLRFTPGPPIAMRS